MLGRRKWIHSAGVGVITLLAGKRSLGQEGTGFNAAQRPKAGGVATLGDQLTQGLRAVTNEQKQFVQVVVAYVEAGKLPEAMVNIVFTWARERNPSVPFPYFQYALRVLSARRGLNLPKKLPS
jgi:hypothetical protein